MKDDFFRTVEEFRDTQPAHRLIFGALKELVPTKNDWFAFFVSAIVGAIIAIILGFSTNTVEILGTICDKLIDIQLAVFGCIFTVYSILLAFLSDGYMKRLSRIKVSNKKSMLKMSIGYYESILFLYFINVALSGVLILVTDCIPPDIRLSSSLILDNALASIVLFFYFWFSFRTFYEIKSTIYNTIVLFRASVAYKFLDFAVEDDEEVASSENNQAKVDK